MEEEIRVSRDLADRVEYMVGPPGVGKRIRELSDLSRLQLSFKVAEDIVYGLFGRMETEAAAEQAVKTGIAILNEGVTAAPLQGITGVRIKNRVDAFGRYQGSRYLAIYFAGPMRSAGGTELAIVTVLADYVRRLLGIDEYQATPDEIARFLEELRIYERECARFQFHIPDDTIAEVLKHLPVEVTGIKTDPVEVSSYRNIPSIETNAVRGGALRVVHDGLAGRAPKAYKAIKELNIPGWEWLKNISGAKREAEENESTYMQDIIAGRPVFAFPSTSKFGSRFRFRYGRARNTGLASVGVHPATMAIVNDFIAVGTQLRLEMPGKAGVVNAVDTIEPPVVRLNNGTVMRVENSELARKVQGNISKILFLGDLLVSFAEFLENDKPLVPSSYVEEWWASDFRYALSSKDHSMEETSRATGICYDRLEKLKTNFLREKPTAHEALTLSRFLGIPLHPHYTYFWRNITIEEFQTLRNSLINATKKIEANSIKEIKLPNDSKTKTLLEKLLIPHEVIGESIVLTEEASIIFGCFGLDKPIVHGVSAQTVHEAVQQISGIYVKDKFAFFVGARMGRPEKADIRKMKPPVHVLFPIGLSGGLQRNVSDAVEHVTEVQIVQRRCQRCGASTFLPKCPKCATTTQVQYRCPRCSRALKNGRCETCDVDGVTYESHMIDVKENLTRAAENLRLPIPHLLKGVKGLMNANKIPEPLEKGLLRAKWNLTVFRDGTVRYDMTNAPLTHFSPREVGVSVARLRSLGYDLDKEGLPLEGDDQVIELRTQDIIIPEKSAEFLLRVGNFVDDLLVSFYELAPFYKFSEYQDLLGHIVIGLSPHTSAGVLGRIVGFSKVDVCYTHPLWISAKRRDCDGDEDSIMLALDALLNFSREYLPAQIGGIMDACLLLTPVVNPLEVDDQVWTLDLSKSLPAEFFLKSQDRVDSKLLKDLIDNVGDRIATPFQFENYGYLHSVNDLNAGTRENTYKKLQSMREKLESQMTLVSKIEGVDAQDVAKRVLTVHFMRDIMGNLKVFATQQFRCKRCSAKYRRIPLKGRCLKCGGQLSLTVFKGAVNKYLEDAAWIAKTFGLENYYSQRVELIKDEIEWLFTENDEKDKEKLKDVSLTEFM